MNSHGLNVLVIGAGMYTCGRGTDGFGTVLPALYQAAKEEKIVRGYTACATSRRSIEQLGAKSAALAKVLGQDLPHHLHPPVEVDPEAYRHVLAEHQGATGDRRFDCAVIAVPDHLHYEVARNVLEAGIHTLLVKPFVTRTADGRQLISRADSKGLVGMVEFHKRWDQSNVSMRDAVAAGRIGKPLYCVVEYSQRKCIPEEAFSAWVRDTNVFQYLGVHYADMVHYVTGAAARRVMAVGQKSWLAQKDIDTYDSIQTLIEWQSRDGHRFTSTHLTNWIDPNCTSAMSDQRIKVIGTRGRIECDQKHRGVQFVTDDAGVEDINPYFSTLQGPTETDRDFAGYGYQSILSFLRDVRDVLVGNKTPAQLEGRRPTFRSSLVSTAVVEANNKSLAQNGAWIEVDDVTGA